jgi:tetratricopeptide (TPR) repeat protein
MPRKPGTHVDDPAAVGLRLREARQRAGLSQRQLAFDGCTAAYISRIEAGARVPSLQILHQLARRLGTTAGHLATGGEIRDVPALLDEAEAAARLDDLDRAEELYDRVLAGDPLASEAAVARMGLAEVASRRGNPRRVVELLEGLALDDETLDPAAAAWAADRLGRAHAQLGEYELTLVVLGRALEQARRRDDESAVLRFSVLLANALLDSGNSGRAEERLAEALELADRIRDPMELARLWWSQSRLHIQQNRPELAARYVRQTIALLDANEHTGFAAAAYQLLARIENDRGEHASALELVDRGEPIATATGNRYHLALFELERSRALAGLGEATEAGAVAMRAAALLEETNPAAAGRGYAVIAGIFRELGEVPRARELYELAADRLPEDDPFQAEIHAALGELLESEGLALEAMEAYKRAALLRARAAAH